LKVLIITPSYLPIIGGSETLTRTLAYKLNEKGLRVDVMTLNMNVKWRPINKKEKKHEPTFEVYKVPSLNPTSRLPINPLAYLRMFVMPNPDFLKVLNKYDIIHFLGEADLSLPLLSSLCHQPKIMHCVGIPSLYNYLSKTRARYTRKLFMAIFSRLADLYIFESKTEEKLLLSLGFKAGKTLVLPYGVDTDVFQPKENMKHKNMVLFIGRIGRSKGLHILLQSLSYLKIETQVVIIGPAWEKEYFRETEKMWQQINREGVHKVMYLGQMSQDDLIPWYQKATVLVRPDVNPSSGGLTAMEALACGTPVIGTGNHIVIDGINGIIVPTENPKNLAEALYKLLTDQELRMKYGIEGRKIMELYFSWRNNLSKLINVYRKLLASAKEKNESLFKLSIFRNSKK